MSELRVDPAPAAGLRGRLRVPGDKSISHRALLLAARAEGTSTLRGVSGGDDVAATRRAVEGCGAQVEAGDAPGSWRVAGGPGRLAEPTRVIDVGNSGTGIRLLAGWAAGLEWLTVLEGDASIARRPMGRVVDPLRAMGAAIDGREGGRYPPLVVRGGGLHGIDYRLPVPSAQVKAAVLLAGLAAEGPTVVREAVPTRAHTEELLALAGADIEVVGGDVTLRPGRPLAPLRLDVPGDPSQAAYWIVAACVVPGSEVSVEGVYVGPGRAGFLDVLDRMGADIDVVAAPGDPRTATVTARYGPLVATTVGGAEVPGLIDEIPVLAVAAAAAAGTTAFGDASELRVKESDRVETVTAALRALGIDVDDRPDGLAVVGRAGRPWSGGAVDAGGDHRIAMAAAVAALAARGPVVIGGWESVATSYPTFEEDLHRCVS